MEDVSPFHEGERFIQELTESREEIEAAGRKIIRNFMPEQHRNFFVSNDCKPIILVSTLDNENRPWASILVGEKFVTTPETTSLEIRTRIIDGDPLKENIKDNAFIGLLGIEFATRRRNRMNGKISLIEGGFKINVDQSFGNCPKYIQARNWKWKNLNEFLEGKHPEAIHSKELTKEQQNLISTSDTLFLATSFLFPDKETQKNAIGCDVSHRGGSPGFVQVLDNKTIKWPDYLGNYLFNSLGNIHKNPKCGLLFIDFKNGSTLQLTGKGKVLFDESSVPGAQRMVSFEVEEVIFIEKVLPFEWDLIDYSPYNPKLTMESDSKLSAMGLDKLVLKCSNVTQEAYNVKTYRFSGGVAIPQIAGQYATFELEADGKKFIRTWTISSSPVGVNWGIAITVKRKQGGIISNWLFDNMKEGMTVTLQGISGYFTLSPGNNEPIPQKILMIAGGVGITPMISMIRWLVHKKEMIDVTLLYSVSKEEDRVFTQELEDAQKNSSIRVFTTVSQPSNEWKGMKGRISKETISSLVPDLKTRVVYLCGPELFMQNLEDALHELEVPSSNLKTENFDF